MKKTVFSTVRFGNVLNSRGSVIPLFARQIGRGGPVTVTDPEMTRFFMDIPSAVGLILSAGRIARGKEIFILKMPALRILDLAEVMIEELAPRSGRDPEDIRIEFIGRRQGEKLYEELMTEEEAENAYESEEMFTIFPRILPEDESAGKGLPEGFTRAAIREFSSRRVKLLDKEGIRAIISGLQP
jgi:FlaA1/EpsC-like NDP-sugar epimerase